jgi:hypothetical protein
VIESAAPPNVLADRLRSALSRQPTLGRQWSEPVVVGHIEDAFRYPRARFLAFAIGIGIAGVLVTSLSWARLGGPSASADLGPAP